MIPMEKFMKKMWKKSEGFTLVELIVVIAILGILAAVAVPAYSGYITKAKEAGDITALDAIKTAAVAAMAEDGAVTKIEVVVSDAGAISTVTAYLPDGADSGTDDDPYVLKATSGTATQATDFATYLGTAPTLESDTYKGKTATWTQAGDWTAQ